MFSKIILFARFQLTTVDKESNSMRAYTQLQQQLLTHWSEALETEAFQDHRITLDHLIKAL